MINHTVEARLLISGLSRSRDGVTRYVIAIFSRLHRRSRNSCLFPLISLLPRMLPRWNIVRFVARSRSKFYHRSLSGDRLIHRFVILSRTILTRVLQSRYELRLFYIRVTYPKRPKMKRDRRAIAA